MKKKTEKYIKLIVLQLGVILIAGIIVGWIYLTFPEVMRKKGIPFAPQFVLIMLMIFIIGIICYKGQQIKRGV